MHGDHSEAALRAELAACYRLFDWLGWTELIFNHITMRLPQGAGEEASYLINPFGLHYAEITPANLVAVNLAGRQRDEGAAPINPAGFVIHSAIHAARPDAHCIMHVHTTAGCAVASKEDGLRHDNFYSAMLYGDIAYHDYEGVTTNVDEQPRLVASLAQRNHLILRNHGLLVTGPDIPTAFMRLWVLQRACEIQLAADAAAGGNRTIPTPVLAAVQKTRVAADGSGARMVFEAMLRRANVVFEV